MIDHKNPRTKKSFLIGNRMGVFLTTPPSYTSIRYSFARSLSFASCKRSLSLLSYSHLLADADFPVSVFVTLQTSRTAPSPKTVGRSVRSTLYLSAIKIAVLLRIASDKGNAIQTVGLLSKSVNLSDVADDVLCDKTKPHDS